MQKKKRQSKNSLLLVLVLLFNIVTQTVAPAIAYAAAVEEPPIEAEVETALTVTELIALENPGTEVKVEGYIVGYATGTNSVSRDNFKDDTNFALADTPEETNVENMAFVQLTKDFRNEFGLFTNPTNLDRKVTVVGKAESYFSKPGVKQPSAIQFTDTEQPEEPEVPTELLSIADVRAQETGMARTKGVVTAKLNNTIQIQDETAAIAVRPATLDVEVGDEITVSGKLQNYRGLLQLDGAVLEENGGVATLPKPKPLTGSELADHQSQLAVMEKIKIIDVYDGGSWANYTAVDAEDTEFLIRDEKNNLGLTVGGIYSSITGIVSTFDDDQQIIPRSKQDIIADATTVQPVYATPAAGVVPSGTEVTLQTQTENAKIYYTTDGTDPTDNSVLYTEPIVIEEATTIRAVAILEDLSSSEISEFAYEIYDDEEGMRIHHIQGTGHRSPMVGSLVSNIEGIVTYQYEIRGAHYFHLQNPEEHYDDDPKTSEAIVVYTGRKVDGLEVGDLVEVKGTVDEYYIDGYSGKETTDLPVTQINARNDRGGEVKVVKKDVELPAPIQITSSTIPEEISGESGFDVFDPENYSIDFWESIEGMRVEVASSTAVAPQQHGDLVVVTNEYESDNLTSNGGVLLTEAGPNAQSIQFKLQPNSTARNFAVKTGDQFTKAVPGVVNYGFGNYKVYADLEYVQSVHAEGLTEPKGTSIVKDENKLTVATYNVENFSANTSYTSDEKAKNIARGFVRDMDSPDIIGIVEVMANNATSSTSPEADQSYERLITAIEAEGGPVYEYANIDPEFNQDGGVPGGNIRVGYLYNPLRVTMTEAPHGGTHDAVDYENGKLTLNPGRVAPESFANTRKPLAAQFEFQGESVVIVNNHLNSKTGDDPYYGQNQPPIRRSEAKRHELAKIVNNFVKDILTDNPEENIVVLGDMNDFQFSPTLELLAGDELTNLVNAVPTPEQYSYVYQGNSQVLDHILVSNHLAKTAAIEMIHVNADFTDMHGRASDHDPVLAQLDFKTTEEPVDPEEFDLSLMHMNDTHARVENYAKMLTAIKDFRKTKPESLLFHAGDVFSGTLYFNEFRGQADLALMNLMDIDAMVFGNHEFDLGDSPDGHKALANFVRKANFPMLGTNIDFSGDAHLESLETKKTLVENAESGAIYDSIILEVEGEKVGVFGLTTEDTIDIASPVAVTFNDYLATAQAAVDEFEEAGIDKIIALTHLGYDSAPVVGNDLLLAESVEGIDIIVGGHSHTKLSKPKLVNEETENPTVIVQAGQYADNLGTLNVTFNEKGEIIDHSGALIAVKDLPADPAAAEVLKEYKDRIDQINNEEIGATAVKDFPNPRQVVDGEGASVRANETELGNLITDAMLAKAKEKFSDTVIALQNGGGIRAPINAGPITVGEVIQVLPFGNDPVIAELTGQEIKDILEHSVRNAPGENGGFLHISGMKYFYDSTKAPGQRVVAMFTVQDGKRTPINPDEKYLVTTNGFTGRGGDGFDTFTQAYAEGRVRDIGEIDWQQLRDYMVQERYLAGIVDAEIEGRIVDLKNSVTPEVVDYLIGQFDEEEPVTEEYKEKVAAARAAYDALTDEQKRLVDPENVEKLKRAEARIAPADKKGWVKEGNEWYYYDENGQLQIGWIKVNNIWYYTDSNGVMQTGWVKLGDTWYYLNPSGAMQTGWMKLDEVWYYLNPSGAMQTGWVKLDEIWYYLNPSGAMQTGWVKLNNTWYYLNPSGAMQTGWVKLDNTWYYLNAKGAMQTGWVKLDNIWYYLNPSGAMQTGWVKLGNTWYYLNAKGAMQTGWVKLGNTWYYLNSNGAMQTGWVKLGNTWYYLNSNGAMQTGWVKLGQTWYYLNSNGAMQTGWLKLGSNWYYLNKDGSMQTKSKMINGKWYRFDSSGRML